MVALAKKTAFYLVGKVYSRSNTNWQLHNDCNRSPALIWPLYTVVCRSEYVSMWRNR